MPPKLPTLGEEMTAETSHITRSSPTPVLGVGSVVLNAPQRDVFDNLLAVGADRPTHDPGLADELRTILKEGTADALAAWTESSLWLSKSQITSVLRCEGQTVAYASDPTPQPMRSATVAGIVAHRAIHLAYTHPDYVVRSYVDWALEMILASDPGVADFWNNASPAHQSDVIAQAMEKTVGFLDSWPPLQDAWEPRFEVPIQVKIGKLKLAGRVDLMLGRPRPPRQTMLLADLKTGALSDHHGLEAAFYGLLATLRSGVAPFRSVIYSIASGEWTEPADMTPDLLRETAHTVADAVSRHVALLMGMRDPSLTPGRYCSWCPARGTCPAAELPARPTSSPTQPVTIAPTPVPAGRSAGDTDPSNVVELSVDRDDVPSPQPEAGAPDDPDLGPFAL